jgi:hypothetical protein
MAYSNRRLVESNSLIWDQVDPNDLFLISDVSDLETKKILAEELKKYITDNGFLEANLNGTASYSNFSNSSSWAPPCISASYSLTSSYSNKSQESNLAISSSYALSASYSLYSKLSLTASYALKSETSDAINSINSTYSDTASYLLYISGKDNGTAHTSTTSSLSLLSETSSYLLYVLGKNNGTASHAMTSSLAESSSFLIYTGVPNGTSSHSIRSDTTLWALTSSYLYYDDILETPNGTASYSITSSFSITSSYARYVNSYMDYGRFTAKITDDNTASILLTTNGTSPTGDNFLIEFEGDILTIFTGSHDGRYRMMITSSSPSETFNLFNGPIYSRFILTNETFPSGALTKGQIINNSIFRGAAELSGNRKYTAFLYLYGSEFFTKERSVSVWIRSKFQDIIV